MKERLDKKLVELGLALTRSQALQFIQDGMVFDGDARITKPSYKTDGQFLRVEGQTHYVGRGAFKLLKAFNDFSLVAENKVAADIGASTGGFTQVLLEKGAAKVYAIDVGQDQLDARLKHDSKVIDMSGVNIRHLETLPEKIDFMVADLSFISLELVLLNMRSLLKADGEMVVLVKPQFEVGKNGIDGQGIVQDRLKHLEVLKRIRAFAESLELGLVGASRSQTIGKIGNQEYLYWFRGQAASLVTDQKLKELTQ